MIIAQSGARGTLVLLLFMATVAAAEVPLSEPWRYAEPFSHSGPEATEYLLGLGALQKIRSRWQFKDSEIVAGEIERITWQIQEGFTAEEGLQWYRDQLPEGTQLLFECEGRACGSSAQWASRVFDERILYGHVDRQRYSAWRFSTDSDTWTLVLYGIDRANRRHLIRLDRLRHLPPASEAPP